MVLKTRTEKKNQRVSGIKAVKNKKSRLTAIRTGQETKISSELAYSENDRWDDSTTNTVGSIKNTRVG